MDNFRIYIEQDGVKGEVIYTSSTKMINVIHPKLEVREKIKEYYNAERSMYRNVAEVGKPPEREGYKAKPLENMNTFLNCSMEMQHSTGIKVSWKGAGPTYEDYEISESMSTDDEEDTELEKSKNNLIINL